MAKTGRPKAENPKNILIKARISQDTDIKLKTYCEQHKISVTDVIRKGIDMILEKDR